MKGLFTSVWAGLSVPTRKGEVHRSQQKRDTITNTLKLKCKDRESCKRWNCRQRDAQRQLWNTAITRTVVKVGKEG